MSNAPSSITIPIDPTANLRAPDAVITSGGTLGFTPAGNLLVLEELVGKSSMAMHELALGAGGWTEVRKAEIKGARGVPIGRAVCPDGTRFAFGAKTAKIHDWPSAKAAGSAGAMRYALAVNSLGFSPSGAWLVVADGGRVSPRNRTVVVHGVATGKRRVAIKTDEWCFVQAGMLDDDTVVTLGLGLDWDLGKGSTDEDLVLGCYDATTGQARWRRRLRDGQRAGLDRAARQIWIADEAAPRGTGAVRCLAADDGRVLRSVAFRGGWRAGVAPPVVVRPGLLAVEIMPVDVPKPSPRLVLLDIEAGRQLATLGEGGGIDYNLNHFAAAHPAGTWLAVVDYFGTETHLWRLP